MTLIYASFADNVRFYRFKDGSFSRARRDDGMSGWRPDVDVHSVYALN